MAKHIKDKSLDENTIIDFNNGDQRILSHLFDQYYNRLCAHVTRIINDEAEAEDIVLGALTQVWEKRQHFSDFRAIRNYLYTVVENAGKSHLRKMKTKAKAHGHIRNQFEISAEQIERERIQTELCQMIYNKIECLPPRCQQVFKLSFLDGLSDREIEEQLGLRPSTVRNHKSRAIELMKKNLLNDNTLISCLGLVIVIEILGFLTAIVV